MKKKSLGTNALLNGIKDIMSVLFPLITFPYVSKVLQVDNLGKYNFSSSIIDYFLLLAQLGISTYAVREGTKVREQKEKIQQLSSELFSISIVSMLISYLLLFITVIAIPKLHNYSLLIAIFSLRIFFRIIGTEWIYTIYEDYAYITKRSILFQCISLLLLFLFVKKQEDIYVYAFITVLADAGSNILNYIHAKKICRIKLLFHYNYKIHMKPIMIIFAYAIATTIYVSSYTTILGFMVNDYHVGLYSVAVKIYSVVKMLLSTLIIVSIPRLSSYIGSKQIDIYNSTFNKILNSLFIIVFPAVVGLFCLNKEVILFLSDITYIEASNSVRLLSLSLIVCLFGWLFRSCVLVPNGKESKVLIATVVSAVLNIVLNLILIPFWKQDAAAITTIIAEGCAMIMSIKYAKGLVEIRNFAHSLLTVCIGCVGIIVVCYLFKLTMLSNFIYIVVCVICSALIYTVILVMTKNQYILSLISDSKSMISNKFSKK